MKHASRATRKALKKQSSPRGLRIGGPSIRYINMLEAQSREKKEELARMRANFITYLYEHSEPL